MRYCSAGRMQGRKVCQNPRRVVAMWNWWKVFDSRQQHMETIFGDSEEDEKRERNMLLIWRMNRVGRIPQSFQPQHC